MRDREFINRFCAFEILGLEGYKGEMDDFLGKVLDKMNDMNEAELNQLQGRFRLSMINNRIVFEKDAFRKPTPQGRSRKPINAALWDILSTGLSRYETSVVEQRAEKLREGLEQLLANQEFEKSVTYATNDTKQVQVRFNRMIQFLKEIFS